MINCVNIKDSPIPAGEFRGDDGIMESWIEQGWRPFHQTTDFLQIQHPDSDRLPFTLIPYTLGLYLPLLVPFYPWVGPSQSIENMREELIFCLILSLF